MSHKCEGEQEDYCTECGGCKNKSSAAGAGLPLAGERQGLN